MRATDVEIIKVESAEVADTQQNPKLGASANEKVMC